MNHLGPFKVGETPGFPIVLDLESRDDLAAYTHVKARLLGPSGGLVADLGQVAIQGEELLASFPFPADPFATRGLYSIAPKLVGGTKSKHLDAIPVIVEAEDGWATLASARQTWGQQVDDLRLFELLDIAREQVATFAPGNPTRGTTNLRAAQVMQARNILNAGRSDPSAEPGEFVITPYPLDKFVRELIRPRRAVGRVG